MTVNQSPSISLTELPWLTRHAQRWFTRRTFGAEQTPPLADLAARKSAEGMRISVGLPALNEAETVGPICEVARRCLMDDVALVDQLAVLDGGSTDDTVEVARRAGAQVINTDTLLTKVPPVRGKGESLWRSLSYLDGDIVVWIDADIRNFGPHFVARLVAPILQDPAIHFTKGFYRRPIELGGDLVPSGGGRVTELLARPLINTLFPELAGFLQPLSGEYAGRRESLRRVPFFTGYGVEIGLLIDLLDVAGLDALAQVDLDERVHRNRPLDELSPMAFVVAKTVLRRAEEWGRIKATIDYPSHPLLLPRGDGELEVRRVDDMERPPMEVLDGPAATPGGEEAAAR